MAKVIENDGDEHGWLKTSSKLISLIVVEGAIYGPPYKRDQGPML